MNALGLPPMDEWLQDLIDVRSAAAAAAAAACSMQHAACSIPVSSTYTLQQCH
jgi:hypothetical protein